MKSANNSPILYVVVGPNGSGKSSISTALGIDGHLREFMVNPDLIACSLEIMDPVERNLKAAEIAESARRGFIASKVSFGFETVGSTQDKLDFLREAKEKGYRIFLLFVTTRDPEINIARVRQRVLAGGHDVPEDKIRSRYHRTMGFLREYVDVSDIAYVFDNSGRHPRVVFIKDASGTHILRNHRELEWFDTMLYSHYRDSIEDIEDSEG